MKNDKIAQAMSIGLVDLQEKFSHPNFRTFLKPIEPEEPKIEDSEEYNQLIASMMGAVKSGSSDDKKPESMRELEYMVISDTIKHSYGLLMANSMTFSIALSSLDYYKKDLVTLKDFYNAIVQLVGEMEKFNGRLEKHSKAEDADEVYIYFNKPENVEEYRKVLNLMRASRSLFACAAKIEKLCKDKSLSEDEFLEIMMGYNEKFADALLVMKYCVGEIKSENTFDDIFNQQYNLTTLMLDGFKDIYDKNYKAIIRVIDDVFNSSSPKKVDIKSEADIERRVLINAVNQKYDEFVNGTLNDLNAQVPYSARTMYENLLVKFEKFVKSFNMPLAAGTNIKMAKEVNAQLNNLIDYVSKISENSTVSITNGQQMQ